MYNSYWKDDNIGANNMSGDDNSFHAKTLLAAL